MGHAAEVPEEIREALLRGATVVTGKQRAARALREQVDRGNRAAGLAGWAPARVLAWDSWLSGLWHAALVAGATDRMLLNRTQERTIWKSVIEADAEVATLRSAASLADLAAASWADLARYGGLGRLAGSATNADTEAFIRWSETFGERCRSGRYIPQARLEDALRHIWREHPGSLPAGQEILLVGFDRMYPAQDKLLAVLRDAGRAISRVHEKETAPPGTLAVAPDESSERAAAVAWARSVLEQDPNAAVAILVPGLKDSATARAQMERTLRAVLAPEAQAITFDERALPYEFSTGVSLDRTGVGASALAILEWAESPLGLERVRELLLSPYFAGGGERSARAAFDAFELRKKTMLRPEISLAALETWAARSRHAIPELLTCLQRMRRVADRQIPGQKSYADWAGVMREMLGAAGWAAGTSSVEFQAKERMESTLDEMATLDFEGGRVPYGRAFEALRGIAEGTTFAPESRGAPIQVMGPEESAGLRFNAVWMMRAGDGSWPPAEPSRPLLGWPLRRDLGMPGADPARDMAHARRVTERIAGMGGSVTFSYARQSAERLQRPSAALNGLKLEEVSTPAEPQRAHPDVDLEIVEDVAALPLAHPERQVSGGAAILKAQAACAFHAFAQYRLFATAPEPRDTGMNASERGMAIHTMLEHFWREVETQERLKGLSIAQRDEVLARAVEQALQKVQQDPTSPWEEAYLEGERRRLMRLGQRWLEIEANRVPGFTVVRQESEQVTAIGPLHLRLRLDRVDQTEHGAVLIDYKTGKVSGRAWFGDRPDEPQVPLYAALTSEGPLHGVAFGVVRPGKEMHLLGHAAHPGTSTKSVRIEAPSLTEQVENWHDVLVRLAESFVAGDATVSPKVYPGTCQYCAHRLLCRVEVASLKLEDDEQAEEGELG